MQKLSKSKSGYTLVQGLFKKRFQIPEDWEYPKFSDVVQVNPPTKIDSKKSFYVPMEAVNIQNGSVDNFEERNIDENPSLPKFQKNDVLFARITPSTENGKICIIEDFPDYGIASSELTVLRPSNKVLPRYLFYFVQSYRIKQYAISQMMGTTGRQRVPDRVFKKDLNFELPLINEQLKIIQIISNIHSLIQKTDQIIEQTKRLKKGLMQRLLTKGVGHTKFKKTRIGKIPEEWQLELSHDLFSFVTSGSRDWAKYYSERGTIMIRIENLDHETIYPDFTTVQRVALPDGIEGVRTRVKPNDILVSITADVGMVGVISDAVPEAYVNQHIALIRPNEGINSKYIARYLSWHEGGVKQFRELQGGVTKFGLTLKDIKKIWIPWPCDAEQHKIVSILDSVELVISKNLRYRYKLQDLKKGLMQKLLTGKIRVKV